MNRAAQPTARRGEPALSLRTLTSAEFLAAYFGPLKLPCREASNVNMKLVEVAELLELNLKLKLIAGDWQVAHRTRRADTRTPPGAVRAS